MGISTEEPPVSADKRVVILFYSFVVRRQGY